MKEQKSGMVSELQDRHLTRGKGSSAPVAGVLLAGGLGRRMGEGDKPLKLLNGKPLLSHVINRALPQVEQLVLNVNGDTTPYGHYGLPVVQDIIEGRAGPLAGVLTGMQWAREAMPDAKWTVSFATDAPFFPEDMVGKFLKVQQQEEAQIVCARSNGREHPVFALWSTGLIEELREAMVVQNVRKIDAWTQQFRTVSVEFDTAGDSIDPFFNINRPEELATAEHWLSTRQT